MKTMIRLLMSVVIALVSASPVALAQKIDEARMRRDLEIAENVLSTLIRQQFNNQRTFFPLEIKGSYQPGYGVTFTLPADYTTPIVFSMAEDNSASQVFIWGDEPSDVQPLSNYNYTYERESNSDDRGNNDATYKLRDKAKEKRRLNMDSVRDAYNNKVIEAAKMFMVDYGDMITQLSAQEKIVVSNQGNQPRIWVGQYFNAPKRTHLSVEATKADLLQFKQGKISRDQALSKIKVINTETLDVADPDLELLSSIFNRLYRVDLAKTFFIQDNIYYERLKDFGAIYYMQVFSSDERDYKRYVMPTIGLDDVDQETRNKKVAELYPKFEQELKENIIEYGRTLKSLKDDEVLIFQVKLTRCASCGIPSSLEYTVKGAVLKDFSAGKLDKTAALGKVAVKKGANQ